MDCLTYDQYVSLAALMLINGLNYRVIIFYVLMWNLAYRGDSMEEQFLINYSWVADMILINLVKSKGNLEGGRATETRLAANPTNPLICPLLMLAILMACRDSYSPSLWDGRDEANNFRRDFKAFVDGIDTESLHRLGIDGKRLGPQGNCSCIFVR